MKRYSEYKDSGVEWIGEIPRHWKMLPFMHCLKRVNTKKKTSIPKMNFQESGKFPIIDQGASFIAGWTDSTDSVISDNLPIVIFGDHTRIFKYVDFPFAVGADGTQLLYPNYDILNPRFFYYALLNLKIPDRGYNRHYRYLRKFSVACPTLPIQTQIANFLDRKTEQIDELIRIKERKIEVLQEQRTILINHTVTKGLDPNVEMKPSSVEWIGDIPKHWTLTRLKYISNIPVTYGINIAADRYTTEGIRLIRITDIGEGGNLAQKGVYLSEDCVSQEQMLNSYDLLLSRSGATVGKSYLHLETGKYTSAGYLVRFNFDDYWTSKFIYYVTLSHFYRNWLEQQVIISTIQNVNGEKYSNFQIPIPLRQEQKQIVNFLDQKTKQIDRLITTEHRKIELLKEYRQSLISEAVTGKIDVRNEV